MPRMPCPDARLPTHHAAHAVHPPAVHAVADLESQLAGAGVDVPPAPAAAAATAEAPIIPEDFWSPAVTGRSASWCNVPFGLLVFCFWGRVVRHTYRPHWQALANAQGGAC